VQRRAYEPMLLKVDPERPVTICATLEGCKSILHMVPSDSSEKELNGCIAEAVVPPEGHCHLHICSNAH
jgi:hypothetical protein